MATLQQLYQSIVYIRPKKGPREAFADRSWKDPTQLGPLGPIRWENMSPRTIAKRIGISHGEYGDYAVVPVNNSTTIPAPPEVIAERFANPVVDGRQGKIYPRLGTDIGFNLECGLVGIYSDKIKVGDGMVFCDGMTAISHTILPLVTAGDNIVVHRGVYGCHENLLRIQMAALGVEVRFVDLRDPRVLRKAIDRRTRAVVFETPSNPVLDLINIANVAAEVKGRCPVIVDNTFSAIAQNPLVNDANLMFGSLTKVFDGNSNATGGFVLGSGKFMEYLFYVRKDFGGNLSPEAAGNIINGIRTVFERYDVMEKNAIQLAEAMLKRQTDIGDVTVSYPLFNPTYKELEGVQMKGPGYMILLDLGTNERARAFTSELNNSGICVSSVSLGTVYNLISIPADSTHSTLTKQESA